MSEPRPDPLPNAVALLWPAIKPKEASEAWQVALRDCANEINHLRAELSRVRAELGTKQLPQPGMVTQEEKIMAEPAMPSFVFWYTNYRGATEERHVRPLQIMYGTTEYYPNPTWLLRAWDCVRGDYRVFALHGISDRRAHFSGMSNAQMERLFLLAEESSSVIHAICKQLRHGPTSFDPRSNVVSNRDHLAHELGRVDYAIEKLTEAGDLDGNKRHTAHERAALRVKPFLHHQQE